MFENYIQYIDELRIPSLEGESFPLELIKRTMYLALIDSISVKIYPKLDHNRERFVKLINEKSNFSYKNTLSVPAVLKKIHKKENKDFQEKYPQIYNQIQECSEKLESRRESNCHWEIDEDITVSQDFCDFIERQSKDSSLFKIKRCLYPSLLYDYRCTILHEQKIDMGLSYDGIEYINRDSCFFSCKEEVFDQSKIERQLTFSSLLLRNLASNLINSVNNEKHGKI